MKALFEGFVQGLWCFYFLLYGIIVSYLRPLIRQRRGKGNWIEG